MRALRPQLSQLARVQRLQAERRPVLGRQAEVALGRRAFAEHGAGAREQGMRLVLEGLVPRLALQQLARQGEFASRPRSRYHSGATGCSAARRAASGAASCVRPGARSSAARLAGALVLSSSSASAVRSACSAAAG